MGVVEPVIENGVKVASAPVNVTLPLLLTKSVDWTPPLRPKKLMLKPMATGPTDPSSLPAKAVVLNPGLSKMAVAHAWVTPTVSTDADRATMRKTRFMSHTSTNFTELE